MSIKTTATQIDVEDYETLDDLVYSLEIHLANYSEKHPDFSCTIEKYVDSNKVVVKTLNLGEHAN